MKIIFSRKGFDASGKCGRIPSPILPDGTLLSLPIPEWENRSLVKYRDLKSVNGHSPAKVIFDLTGGRDVKPTTKTHFDPDLRRCMLPRRSGWRPIFGPHPSCHTHMTKQQVKIGDLILFFGWFRKVHLVNGTYCFTPNEPDLHVLFGWLQIGEMRCNGFLDQQLFS